MVFEIDSGKLGAMLPEETVSRNAVVREMSTDVFLTIEVAENLGNWLLDHVKQAKALTGGAK